MNKSQWLDLFQGRKDTTNWRLLLQLLEPHLGHLCDYLSSPTTSQTILLIHVYCYSYLSLTWGTCVTTCHHRPPLRRSYWFTFIVTVTWASPGAPVWLPVITDHLSDDPTDSRLSLQLLEPHLGHLCDYLSSPTTSQTILQMFVDMALINPHAFVHHLSKLKHSCEQTPANLTLAAKIIGPVGKTNKVFYFIWHGTILLKSMVNVAIILFHMAPMLPFVVVSRRHRAYWYAWNP